jgi:hypothetical protein
VDCYCGIDWTEGHHDVAIVGNDGKLLAKKRIGDDPAIGLIANTGRPLARSTATSREQPAS